MNRTNRVCLKFRSGSYVFLIDWELEDSHTIHRMLCWPAYLCMSRQWLSVAISQWLHVARIETENTSCHQTNEWRKQVMNLIKWIEHKMWQRTLLHQLQHVRVTKTHTHRQLHLFACDVSVAGVSFNQLQFAVYGDWQTAAESIKFVLKMAIDWLPLFCFYFHFDSFRLRSLRMDSVRPPTGEWICMRIA